MKNNLFLFFVLGQLSMFCQPGVNKNYLFIDQLTNNHKNKEAIFLLHNEKGSFSSDTTDFLLGYNHHFLKHPDSAAYYFSRVPASASFFVKSRFFQSLNFLYLKKYEEAANALNTISGDTLNNYGQLYLLMQSGNYLLQRNYKVFDSLSGKFAFDNYKYSSEQADLLELKNALLKQKKKSPLLAGLMSAVVPGLGKFYAGKKGAAMATLLTNAVLAGIVVENYYRAGSESPQFIAFGTIFSFFYVGNIIGSVYSIKQQTRSVNGKINNAILATIHISINRFFVK